LQKKYKTQKYKNHIEKKPGYIYSMSNAVASARKRRAGLLPEPQQTNQMQNMPPATGAPQGLTLQQVISLINTRLLKLEKFMNDSSSSTFPQSSENKASESTSNEVQISNDAILDQLQQIVDEYNVRFNVFSEEISKLKDTILSLQSFTMEVNKSLYQERIQILSDMGDSKDTYMLNTENDNVSTLNLETEEHEESENK
jgi:hypothetical protein